MCLLHRQINKALITVIPDKESKLDGRNQDCVHVYNTGLFQVVTLYCPEINLKHSVYAVTMACVYAFLKSYKHAVKTTQDNRNDLVFLYSSVITRNPREHIKKIHIKTNSKTLTSLA